MTEYKTYYGKNFNEAYARVRLDLGLDAKIVKQEEVIKGGFLGIGGKPMVKLVASKPSNNNYIMVKKKPNIEKLENDKDIKLERELKEIKETLSLLMHGNKGEVKTKEANTENKLIAKYRKMLRKNDFSDDVIDNILDNIEKEVIDDEKVIKDRIKEHLKNLINVKKNFNVDGNTPNVIFLVGPTGVGKTTTLVKLAANYTIKEKKSIEIFTIDNYRVGAVEQLKLYASIMQSTFQKVDDKTELKNLIKNSKADVILIDTAGRSPKDDIAISQLRDFIKSLSIFKVNVFLVISAATKKNDMLSTAEKYSITNFNYLIYTKLDETESTGALIDASYRIKKPISFVTFGQDVPKHIGVVDPELLVDLAIKE